MNSLCHRCTTETSEWYKRPLETPERFMTMRILFSDLDYISVFKWDLGFKFNFTTLNLFMTTAPVPHIGQVCYWGLFQLSKNTCRGEVWAENKILFF